MSVPKQAQADLPEDPFHFFSEKAPRDGCPHSAPVKWSAVRNCVISRPAGVMSKCQVSPTPGL